MYNIPNITDDYLQIKSLVLPSGSKIVMSLYYMPIQTGWFITNLTYGTFQLNGLRITNSPNMLHQFKNKIPFGLACFSSTTREPNLLQDFLSGSSSLYILTPAEVAAYSRALSAQ
jgi:hypothetical protein